MSRNPFARDPSTATRPRDRAKTGRSIGAGAPQANPSTRIPSSVILRPLSLPRFLISPFPRIFSLLQSVFPRRMPFWKSKCNRWRCAYNILLPRNVPGVRMKRRKPASSERDEGSLRGRANAGTEAVVNRNDRRRRRTRAMILEAADRVFHRMGVDNAIVSHITEEADVAYGSFYNHFKSLDARQVAFRHAAQELSQPATPLHDLTSRPRGLRAAPMPIQACPLG